MFSLWNHFFPFERPDELFVGVCIVSILGFKTHCVEGFQLEKLDMSSERQFARISSLPSIGVEVSASPSFHS